MFSHKPPRSLNIMKSNVLFLNPIKMKRYRKEIDSIIHAYILMRPFRTHSKCWSMLSSTPVPGKIPPGSVVLVLFVVKLWMCLLSDVSTKPSGCCALVPVKPASETSNPSLNVLLMSSSTLPREVPTPTLSRRRTNLNVSPSLTDKLLNAFYCMNE